MELTEVTVGIDEVSQRLSRARDDLVSVATAHDAYLLVAAALPCHDRKPSLQKFEQLMHAVAPDYEIVLRQGRR